MALIGWWLMVLSGLGGPGAGAFQAVPPAEPENALPLGWPTGERWASPRSWQEPTAPLLAKDVQFSLPRSHTDWRRTRDGWEHSSRWTFRCEHRAATLHPIVVGLLELFLSVAALIAFSEPPKRRSRPQTTAVGRSKLRHR